MFRLYDRTRRRICVAAFCLFCIAPTAAVVGWCIQRSLPGRAEREAQRLSRVLGLRVSLDGLAYLRPGAVLYEGLQVADPETGRPLLQCRLLEAARETLTGADGRRKSALVLIGSQPEIETAAIGHLQALLGRLLQGQLGAEEFDVRLDAGEVTLRGEDRSQTLVEFQARLEASSEGARADASFRLAGVESPEPIRLGVARNRQTTPPATSLELDTGGGAVPCTLLAAVLPGLSELGARAVFRGRVWANQIAAAPAASAWEGEATGELGEVDLDRLITARFPHKLSGTAQVTVQLARFRHGRLEEAAGTVAAGPGNVGRSLLEAAVKQLRMVPGAELATLPELLHYEQLAAVFVVDARGVKLQGRCAATNGRVVLMDQQGPLLRDPLLQPQPVVALLQTLVPSSEVQVPATRQTDWLIRHLPVPEIVLPETAQRQAPRAVLRLGERKQ